MNSAPVTSASATEDGIVRGLAPENLNQIFYGLGRVAGVIIVRGVGAGVRRGVGETPGRMMMGVGVGIGVRDGIGVGLSSSSGVGEGDSLGRGVGDGVGVGVAVFTFVFTFEFDVFMLKSKLALAPRLVFALTS